MALLTASRYYLGFYVFRAPIKGSLKMSSYFKPIYHSAKRVTKNVKNASALVAAFQIIFIPFPKQFFPRSSDWTRSLDKKEEVSTLGPCPIRCYPFELVNHRARDTMDAREFRL